MEKRGPMKIEDLKINEKKSIRTKNKNPRNLAILPYISFKELSENIFTVTPGEHLVKKLGW